MSSEVNLSRSSPGDGFPDIADEDVVLGSSEKETNARKLPEVEIEKSLVSRDFRPVPVAHEPYVEADDQRQAPPRKRGLKGILSRGGKTDDSKSSSSDLGESAGSVDTSEVSTPAEKRNLITSLLGANPKERRVRVLLVAFLVFLVSSLAVLWYQISRAERIAEMSGLVSEGATQVQQARTAIASSLQGDSDAFKVSAESQNRLNFILDELEEKRDLGTMPAAIVPVLSELREQWVVVDPALSQVMKNRQILQRASQARSSVFTASAPMLASAEAISNEKLKARRPSANAVAQAGNLAVQTQRVAKEAALRLSPESNQFGRPGDLLATLTSFDRILTELTGRSKTIERYANQIRVQLANFAPGLEAVLSEGPVLRSAQLAGRDIQSGAQAMQKGFGDARQGLLSARSDGSWLTLAAAALGLLAAFCALALSRAYMAITSERTAIAMRQKETAERLQAESKRTNDLNQAAILRLMNELQEVADGDLTVQATVSEDITGAIADSVNYTVEELRSLVSRINSTAEMLNQASSGAQGQMANLQNVSQTQFTGMKSTGQSVLMMARQINEVSVQASESVEVARQSLSASQEGSRAVNNAITGMNTIRDQIQDTSKRIKRLGESSQEIGEIVELISDLTEQTNVLALNAAIQAASAGEAGRGFTIVAEEVQRLAERSAEATKQISGLIKTIQTDTHDAVAAMERSTEGVVEGTRRSDEAGNALKEIGTVSSQLAEMIEEISDTTSEQAASAGTVARSIHSILLVTKETTEGTIRTAGSIQQLTTLSHELKNSVARFKVV